MTPTPAPFAVNDWISQGEGDAGRFAQVRAIYWSRYHRAWVGDLVIFNADGTRRWPVPSMACDLFDYAKLAAPPVPVVCLEGGASP